MRLGYAFIGYLCRDVGIGKVMWSVILTAFVALSVAHSAFGGGKASRNWEVIKQYRFIHFVTSIPIFGLVIVTAVLLYSYVPFMDKNPILWVVSSLFGWGDGSGGGNIIFSGLQWKYYALLFLPVLFFALPSLARYEEEQFREGTRNWRHGTRRSIVFGLVHVMAFIPLGAALALSIGGLWFTYQYFKGGVERSTLYHSAYNSMIVTAMFAIFVIFA